MSLEARSSVAIESTWDLSPMFSNLKEWKESFALISEHAKDIAKFSGTLSQSSEQLLSAVCCYLETVRKLEKLYVYAHLKSDEDTTNSEHLGCLQQVSKLFSEFAAAASFFSPEILSIPEKHFSELLSDERLAPYRRMLTEIARYREHTLSPAEENLLALGSEVFAASSKIFSQLDNADFDFGNIEIDGEEQPLSHGTFLLFLKNSDRNIRAKAFGQFYEVFDQHKHSLSTMLTSSVKKDVFLAKARKYPSAMAGALFGDDIDTAVYDNLIERVSENLAPLHKYYELRKRILGLPELALYDTHVPLVGDLKVSHSYELAVEHVCQSLSPLGSEYVEVLKKGLCQQRWVDRFENKGKRSGAYSSGCYDSYPYLLLNYKQDSLSDMFTLTHEAGHSMHTYLSNQTQSYQDHEYTIFVAEVASTFNEQLLFKHLRQVYKDDPRMLVYLLNQQIDEIKGTFYRQTMFAEFERHVHNLEEEGEPLTVETYRKYYRTLLEKYFGPAVKITEMDELEFMRIPHFYSAFYVYKYATGIAAAIALSEGVLSGKAEAQSSYLKFLKSGGSQKPLALLRDAGVDMRESAPLLATVKLFEKLVAELEAGLSAVG